MSDNSEFIISNEERKSIHLISVAGGAFLLGIAYFFNPYVADEDMFIQPSQARATSSCLHEFHKQSKQYSDQDLKVCENNKMQVEMKENRFVFGTLFAIACVGLVSGVALQGLMLLAKKDNANKPTPS